MGVVSNDVERYEEVYDRPQSCKSSTMDEVLAEGPMVVDSPENHPKMEQANQPVQKWMDAIGHYLCPTVDCFNKST